MIEIIGNVGTQGYALPMVSAYPTDVNSQYLLAWSPVDQALAYVPYLGNALGDFTVTRDLGVGRNVAVTGNTALTGTLAVTGAQTNAGALTVTGVLAPNGGIIPTDGSLEVTGTMAVSGALTGATSVGATSGGNNSVLSPTQLAFQGTKVIGPRVTGWTAATGTATRTTFATGTVTLSVLAEHVKALIDDLITHGAIGP